MDNQQFLQMLLSGIVTALVVMALGAIKEMIWLKLEERHARKLKLGGSNGEHI